MKINPKQLEKIAKQMGMKIENIDAEEVIIKTKNKDIIISNPQVSKVNMAGQDTFQIIGFVSEREKEEFSNEDIKIIMEKTGVSEEEAKKTLKETRSVAEAIIKLKTK